MQPQMAKIIKLRGLIREFTVAVGAYSRGDLLTICSSRGAYSKGLICYLIFIQLIANQT